MTKVRYQDVELDNFAAEAELSKQSGKKTGAQ